MVKGEEGTVMPLCLKGMHVVCDMGWGWDRNTLNLAIYISLSDSEELIAVCAA